MYIRIYIIIIYLCSIYVRTCVYVHIVHKCVHTYMHYIHTYNIYTHTMYLYTYMYVRYL